MNFNYQQYLKKKKANYARERERGRINAFWERATLTTAEVSGRNVFMNHLDEKVIRLKLKQMAANAPQSCNSSLFFFFFFIKGTEY